jgi:hypothetical protein
MKLIIFVVLVSVLALSGCRDSRARAVDYYGQQLFPFDHPIEVADAVVFVQREAACCDAIKDVELGTNTNITCGTVDGQCRYMVSEHVDEYAYLFALLTEAELRHVYSNRLKSPLPSLAPIPTGAAK